MKKDIFENAYFGKAYKTRDGRKAIYTIMSCDCHWLAIQDTSFTWEYNDNGELISGINEAMNIISEWQEPINEEELDEMAEKSELKHIQTAKQCEALGQCYGFDYTTGYKDGYREAIKK